MNIFLFAIQIDNFLNPFFVLPDFCFPSIHQYSSVSTVLTLLEKKYDALFARPKAKARGRDSISPRLGSKKVRKHTYRRDRPIFRQHFLYNLTVIMELISTYLRKQSYQSCRFRLVFGLCFSFCNLPQWISMNFLVTTQQFVSNSETSPWIVSPPATAPALSRRKRGVSMGSKRPRPGALRILI